MAAVPISPQFFQFKDNSEDTKGYPWGQHVYILEAEKDGPQCPACGARWKEYEGPIYVGLERGTKWSDIIGVSGHPHFILSQRVIDALRDAKVRAFEPQPIVIQESRSKKVRAINPPSYYYINVSSGIDIDRKASCIIEDHCPLCFKSLAFHLPNFETSLRALPESWDGSDIFSIRNYPIGEVFCSERVLLMARYYRWTNFRFLALDTIPKHGQRWAGIDYLGKKWPPKWYPDPPNAGKTFQEWLDELRASRLEKNTKRTLAARYALMEFNDEILPGLLDLLKSDDRMNRYDAAGLLKGLQHKGVPVPQDALDAIHAEFGPDGPR